MALENFINKLKSRPTLAKLEAAATDQRLEEIDKSIEIAALEEEKERSGKLLKRWESVAQMAERVPEFLSMIDECIKNYYVEHSKDNTKDREEYDDLITQIRYAVEDFLTNIADKEFLKVIEINLDTISDLCQKMYELDNTFPDLALLDEEKYVEAALVEIGEDKASDYIKSRRKFASHQLGHFHIVGYAPQDTTIDGNYYILDQQAHRVFENKINRVRQANNETAIITFYNSKTYIFFGKSGKLSEGFKSLVPAIGNLYLGTIENYEYKVVVNNQGEILYKTDKYVTNKRGTKAVIRIGNGYNILLQNGTLMFENEEGFLAPEAEPGSPISWAVGGEVSGNITLISRDSDKKFIRLDENLDIIAEGSSRKEVLRKKAS